MSAVEWTLRTFDGREFALPEALAWRLEYGLGSPCDGFWVKIPWDGGQEDVLADGTRMTATRDGEVVFAGVVDECLCRWDEGGGTAEISGRGMQALLLDQQAEAADFGLATLGDVLGRYVTPFGVEVAETVSLPAVSGFSVGSGSSCWAVVYDFARYHGGVTPRFDRAGRLVLSGWQDGAPLQVDGTAPVVGTLWREKRYGVLSEVVVKDVSGWNRQVVVNEDFQARGGQAGRVILLPRKTGFQARRYQGEFQIARSEAERTLVEVTLALGFAAWPGELVEMADGRVDGVWRVKESRVEEDEGGLRTILTLCKPDAVL